MTKVQADFDTMEKKGLTHSIGRLTEQNCG